MIKDDHVYKTVELTGTSRSTFEAAVKSAIRTASRTLRHLRWFEVIEVRGEINNGSEIHWQVTLKVGFTIDSSNDQKDDRTLQIFEQRTCPAAGWTVSDQAEKTSPQRL